MSKIVTEVSYNVIIAKFYNDNCKIYQDDGFLFEIINTEDEKVFIASAGAMKHKITGQRKKIIYVRKDKVINLLTEEQFLHILYHEMGHHMLHSYDKKKGKGYWKMEAEADAYSMKMMGLTSHHLLRDTMRKLDSQMNYKGIWKLFSWCNVNIRVWNLKKEMKNS